MLVTTCIPRKATTGLAAASGRTVILVNEPSNEGVLFPADGAIVPVDHRLQDGT